MRCKARKPRGSSPSPSRTADNGLAGSVQLFQDGVTNSYPASNPAGQAVVTIPVRSNLPFYAKLGAFGNDAIEYLVRIPNAPTGPFADPGLGGVLNPTASSFGFQNGIKPWNPTLQVVAGEGFAPESASAAERRLQGVAGPGMTVGLTPANTRYLDRLSVPLLPGDPLGAIQWTQTNNALAGFENIRANQLFGEWVVLGLNEAPKDALPAEMPADPTQAPGSASDFGFNLDYPTFQADNATSKTFTQKRIEVFRVPPSSTDPYDLNGAGWTSANTTIGVQPIQLPFTFSNFFNQTVWAPAGNAPLQGGLNGFPVPYDSNDPDRKPYKNKTASLQFIRQVFSFSEYLWSQVWARPLVLNQATLSYTDTIFALSGFPYFRRSNPAVWPKASAILPDNSAFDMNVTGGTDFDPATSPAAINGGTPAKTGIGRFYWTAFTPYYNISSGAVVSRTWKSTAAGDPPTTFTGNTGDSTNAFGFLPPQDVVVDKRGRNADGSLNGNPLGGYRVTWFNGTKDANGIPVPPDFWVVEVTTSTGKTNHFLIPGSFPAGQQRATDLLLTDARTFLPSGNSPDQGPDLGGNDTVAPGYCWFDIPAELRPDATTPGVSASIIVFAAKSILKNQPPAGARRLTAADWMDAIKTATANVAIKTNAGNLSYAHKIPFNFFWDIVVVNGPKTFVAP